MTRMTWKTLVALSLTAVFACQSKSTESRAVELAEGYAKALDENSADCDKAAKASLDYAKAHEADFKALAAAEKTSSSDDKQEFERKYKDRMVNAMQKTAAVANKCASSPAFTQSLHDASMLISPK
jgi:hypothetical protein